MIAPGRPLLGVDVGGTTFEVILLDGDGRVTAAVEDATPRGVPAAVVVRTVATAARAVAAGAGVEPRHLGGVGMAVPGRVDSARGLLRFAPNLPGWREVPVAALAAEVLETPVALEHDVRMAAFGESRRGAGAGAGSFVCVTVGTGIGAAVVLDGRLYRGATDAAGEIGHVPVVADGELCGCGRRGCLETVASGRAVAERARGLATRGEAAALLACVNGRVEDITAREVFGAAAAGDPACARVVAAAVAALGAGLTVLVNVLNPEAIAVGGGVAAAGAALLDPLRAAVRASAWTAAAEAVRIVPAVLGTQAGAIGAALFVAEVLRGC